ncbi:MAG: hypothetical protein ACE5IA_04060 [Dehalococcoidia bacterium]
MKIAYEPRLLEEVVFQEARGSPPLWEEYRDAMEPLYELSGEKDSRFAQIHRDLFEKWGFGGRLQAVVDEFPELGEKVEEVFIFRAPSWREERGDITGDLKRLGVRVIPSRFFDPQGLKRFLRHELMHISDMLDTSFGYRNESLGLSPGEEYTIISRYRVLWDIYIDGRLTELGKETDRGKVERLQEFSRAFPFLSHPQKLSCFEGIWNGEKLTHDDFLFMAKEPSEVLARGKEVPQEFQHLKIPGSPCPLCRFPAHVWGDLSSRGDGDGVMELIQADFPHWQQEEGLCERCLELYDLKVGVW